MSGTLEHLGYRGEYVPDKGKDFIKIVGISDFITASVQPDQDRQEVFRELVDDYIKTLEEVGRTRNGSVSA